MDRIYCTVAEMMEDLGLQGTKREGQLIEFMRGASQYLDQFGGMFTPFTETRTFERRGGDPRELLIPVLLSVTSLKNDGVTLTQGTDFALRPVGRHWENGPYSSVVLLSGGSCGAWSTIQAGVEIAGQWGLYGATKDLGANVTSASASDTALTVADGSKISPGMVLLVESEQMLVEATGAATDTTTDLAADIDISDSEFSLVDGSKVNVGEVIKVGFEQMRVEDVSGNAISVQRGWNESKRAAHLAAASVYALRTFTVKRGVNGTTAAVHAAKPVYQQIAPADVNYLCRQIAALMMKKAETGFIGRSGNDELGTGFWVNEFPKNQIEAVMANYVWGGR